MTRGKFPRLAKDARHGAPGVLIQSNDRVKIPTPSTALRAGSLSQRTRKKDGAPGTCRTDTIGETIRARALEGLWLNTGSMGIRIGIAIVTIRARDREKSLERNLVQLRRSGITRLGRGL